jgi:hypothetical protein
VSPPSNVLPPASTNTHTHTHACARGAGAVSPPSNVSTCPVCVPKGVCVCVCVCVFVFVCVHVERGGWAEHREGGTAQAAEGEEEERRRNRPLSLIIAVHRRAILSPTIPAAKHTRTHAHTHAHTHTHGGGGAAGQHGRMAAYIVRMAWNTLASFLCAQESMLYAVRAQHIACFPARMPAAYCHTQAAIFAHTAAILCLGQGRSREVSAH